MIFLNEVKKIVQIRDILFYFLNNYKINKFNIKAGNSNK